MRTSPTALAAALERLGVDASTAPANGWITALCPACDRAGTPSLRVNVLTGGYRCHRCNASSSDDGPTIDVFVSNPRVPSLVSTARSSGDIPPLSDGLVERYHRLLVDSPSVISDLERRRGWTAETVDRLQIGWDGSHVWIPIRDLTGVLVNARMYDPFKRSTIKSFHYANPDGMRRTVAWAPFGPGSLNDEVWLFEGEPDAILAAQLGFPSVCVTGGTGTWTDDLLPVTEGRTVIVAHDMDAAGRKGGRSIRARFESHGRKAILLEFPLSDPLLKDFSDAVLRESRSRAWFKKLALEQMGGGTTDRETEPIAVKLGHGVPGEPISVKAHVLGTHSVPSLVPSAIEGRCNMSWNDSCQRCVCSRHQGIVRADIPAHSRDVLIMCTTPAKGHASEFKRIANVPFRCPIVRFSTVGMWQVQHLKLIPPLADRSGGDSTVRSGVYVSPADGRPLPVRANQLYVFEGRVEPDVLTNEWTLQSAEARPAEDDVETFRLDTRVTDGLSALFRPDEWTVDAVHATIRAETKRLSRHVTRIFGRYDLLEALDLCYHSVLRFAFGGKPVNRGWMSLGVFGDTRTGKSETMSSFATYIGLGKYVMDPSNTSYAGLVGGLQQVGKSDKSWTITWGIIPTNDRGMVIIDEVSSLSTDDIGRMSGMRSSGIAEITKIRDASTPARTRLVMAGNPRGLGRSLSSFPTPVEGWMELIGAPEDVARFDMVVAVKAGLDKTVADSELGLQDHPAPVDLRRSLVKFAWSRGADQVKWADGAEAMAVSFGTEMASKYRTNIPIVEPSEQDMRVARIAVAAAVRTFSVEDNDPNIVVVRRCHVEYARSVLDRAYSGDLGYAEYSDYLARGSLDADTATKLVDGIGSVPARSARALLAIKRVNANTVSLGLGLDPAESRALIAALAESGAARFDTDPRAYGSSMVWTPDFVGLLRRIESGPQTAQTPTEDQF